MRNPFPCSGLLIPTILLACSGSTDTPESPPMAASDDFDNPEVMLRAAQAEFLPDVNGVLPRFFTTNRSYFMHFSEMILQQSDAS